MLFYLLSAQLNDCHYYIIANLVSSNSKDKIRPVTPLSVGIIGVILNKRIKKVAI